MEEQKKSKLKLIIIIGIVVLVIALIIFILQKSNTPIKQEAIIPQKATSPISTTSPDELVPSKSVISPVAVTPEVLKEAKKISPGTSLITKDNVVVTPTGEPVKLNVAPASQLAPKESDPVAAASLGKSANNIEISVNSTGFTPNTFTVKEGQLVNLVLTSTDNFAHIFRLNDKALLAAILGVAGGETRVKSWNAPKKGTYTFRCDIPGHGETGTMIVQ